MTRGARTSTVTPIAAALEVDDAISGAEIRADSAILGMGL